jgi:hypothetical protein
MRAVLEANVVSASYFNLMGLSPVAGKIFRSDSSDDDCRVAVINQAASELYFGGHAVGGAVIDTAGRRTEIVGVVQSPLLRASQRHVEPAIYLPMAQDFLPLMTAIVKTREANDAMLTSVRRTLDGVGGGRRPAVLRTLEDHLKRVALAPERIAMVLVGASAATALALGVLGLYGAMADAARRRRREFGVRLALGAQSWRLIRQVLQEGVRLAVAGAIAGLLGSLIVARWLERITPNAGPLPVWVWLAAPLALPDQRLEDSQCNDWRVVWTLRARGNRASQTKPALADVYDSRLSRWMRRRSGCSGTGSWSNWRSSLNRCRSAP